MASRINRKSAQMDQPAAEERVRQLHEDDQHPNSNETLQSVHDLSLSVEASLNLLVRPGGQPVGLQMGSLRVSVNSDGDTHIETEGKMHDARDLASMAGLLLGVARFFNVGRGK